jgi:phosphatidylethanolamine-binding protein (PEBP) family uncharacterized protein
MQNSGLKISNRVDYTIHQSAAFSKLLSRNLKMETGNRKMGKLLALTVISLIFITMLATGCTYLNTREPSAVTSVNPNTNSSPTSSTVNGELSPTLSSFSEDNIPITLLTTPKSEFTLSSPEVVEGGMLPKEYTCDGSAATLPLEWRGVPANTQSLALIMYTIPSPNESHWYWILYNIPSEVNHLEKNVTGIGTPGNNSVNGRTEYAPPCSKGPGPKLYTYTLFALSAPPQFNVPPSEVNRDVLLTTIKDRTIGSAELNVYYTRY